MTLPPLHVVLMERDGLTEAEAKALIAECREEILRTESYDEAEALYGDYFGLEPDWFDEVLY